ncbi:MAG TPA: hypothetical protein VHJ17_22075 [Thermomonospora sp.]|nr:hypothetical protein [Thermomonospora sp.]
MSADRMTRPRTGTAADVPYLALPPTAVDARPAGPTRLVVAWAGFGPPRTPAALAAALPMTGVPTWRVYLGLPTPDGALPPAGLGGAAAVEAYAEVVENAAAGFSGTLEVLRRDLDLPDSPVGLTGFSAGATVAMLVLASGEVPVSAAAFVAPIVAPARTMTQVVKETGRPYTWTDGARAAAERLDLTARVGELAARDVPLLLVGGSRDRLVRAPELSRLRDRLVQQGAAAEVATFRMAHALAAEPGVEAVPPQPEAVGVDGALTDWFREHLAVVEPPAAAPEPEDETATSPSGHAPLRLEGPRPGPAVDETMPDVTASAQEGGAFPLGVGLGGSPS